MKNSIFATNFGTMDASEIKRQICEQLKALKPLKKIVGMFYKLISWKSVRKFAYIKKKS